MIDDEDEGNIGTPDANWWKTKATPEHFAKFKRHPMTLRFHPEVYAEGEREKIIAEQKAASGTPTGPAVGIPNVGEIKEKKMTQTTVTREQHRGTACVYVDPRGHAYDALITEVWGAQCVNVVYVNDVSGQSDSYGQKLLRATSVMHGAIQQAHGNYWLLPGETRPYVAQPVDSSDPNGPKR